MGRLVDVFCPDLCVERITDIDLTGLQADGCQALMLDLDNTLLPWKSSTVPDDCRCWIEQARELGLKLCIVSNTHNPRRLNRIADSLGVPAFARALKPRPHGFDRAVEVLGCDREKCVVVGDQVMTDIWGGNRAGMFTILVKPMHRLEFVGTKVSRMVEWAILTYLRRLGRLGTISDSDKSEVQETR